MSDSNETFIEDFLLTFRIWSEKDLHPSKDLKIMADLMRRICVCIRSNNHLVENCVRIVLIWLVNHYQDFQNENRYLLDEFESALKENSQHKSQLRLFYMHLSAKSLERQVTVTRSDRNSPLIFSLIGGYECSARLFIGEVFLNNNASPIQSPSSSASSVTTLASNIDLRPGDRVITINGVDCHVMPIARAYELCRSSTHLSLQVKYDPHLFYALIEGRHETKRQIVETFPLTNRLSTSTTASSSSSSSSSFSTSSGFGSSSSTSLSSINSSQNQLLTTMKDGKKEKEGWKLKVRSLVSSTTNQLISSTTNMLHNNSSSTSTSTSNNNNNLSQSDHNQSASLSINSNTGNGNGNATHPRILSYEIPEIIKIYSFEHNDCCFLPIHSSTTVRECIQLALRQFKYSNNYSSRDFALYEYSVIFNNNGNSSSIVGDENAAIKNSSTVVKRLNDGTNDLVANLGLNSRLYLKLVSQPKDSSHVGEPMTDSDIAKEIIKDSSVHSLLTLKGYAIARELTARDFRLFCKIETQQFVYDLAFHDPNSSSSNNKNDSETNIMFDRTRDLQEFERKTNEEMFWTINQVLGEKRSVTKRVKAIKQLIRIATLAMKLNNYNTLFAIISGLMHLSVSRLKSCWDKVPAKHLKQLQKLQQLMDPSRNFYNFRQQLMQKLREDKGGSIIIPFFPLVKKDLSFIWLANQTYITSAPEPQTPSSHDSNKSTQEILLVNWEKMRLLSEKIREIQKMANTTSLALAAINGLNNSNIASSSVSNLTQSTIATNEPIDPNLLFRIFADQISSPENKSSSDHKKLWENQRMTKRVHSDEHELMSRSYSCELPQTPTSSSHAATTRSSIASTMSSNSQLSHPSPTPSSASSSSNSLSMNSEGTPHGPNNNHSLLYRPHRPKFGQTSPKQLRKLLALSDGAVIVPHNSNQTGTSGQSGGAGGNSGHHHHHHHNSQNTASNHTNNASHNPHHHHHHPQLSNNSMYNRSGGNSNNQRISSHHQYHHHGSSSNLMDNNGGGSNSTLSSSTSSNYYYGGSHNNHYSSTTLMNMNQHYGNGYHAPHPSSSTISNTKTTHSMAMINSPYSNGMCCSTGGPPTIPCCSSGSSSLYPNQLYCPCCTPPPNTLMRPSMIMMMPPPQTSGLMHPTCPCANNNSNGTTRQSSRGRQSNSLPPKQSLPVESSSVTSLRRLDQYQMSRGREPSNSSSTSKQSGRRPQCPDYDTTMQRICGGNSSLVTINGSLVGPNGPNGSQASQSTGSKPTVAMIKHHRQASHHREDIV
ncbi:rap guanine nucleotide exchange factor 2-like protein [Euroglyphus maynei]|uniref:Rap guanine nucleotide exchange factor 2-like protein n=1 Tax=Euroglyphus maynei TaxID=6958 RepID=A0A1Y3BBP6_EURMA|nr:rap guanine nucleotide exchange factor 2-like protein [Euroglyphus maynei]